MRFAQPALLSLRASPPADVIETDIKALEQETMGLLADLTGT